MTFTEILEVESSELEVYSYFNLFEYSGVIPAIENWNEESYTLLLLLLTPIISLDRQHISVCIYLKNEFYPGCYLLD